MKPQEYSVTPVGFIETEFKDIASVPLNGRENEPPGVISILPEYKDCLVGLEEFQYIYALAWMHLSDRDVQLVTPRMYRDKPPRGVFASRSPVRPNPIGLTLLEITKIDGLKIYVKGADLLDGTPILDIKKFDHCLDSPN